MPKLGMEPIRRKALMDAVIATIGEHRSLDVTVSQIARRAGVSPALAHHYFGSKDRLIVATMRHLLDELGAGVRAGLAGLADGRARVSAVVRANFAPEQFEPATVAAWLAFYNKAQASPDAQRLLRVYACRLHSNLADALARLAPRDEARRIAEGVAALIDGLYIRRALKSGPPDPASAIALVEDYVDTQLAARGCTDAPPGEGAGEVRPPRRSRP